ncbi:uncharacterized protein TNCV_4772931 [Trichonephila clavipes]|nr:uncharacterized protein TNCV_4772931 [Trichonephila clavipes]
MDIIDRSRHLDQVTRVSLISTLQTTPSRQHEDLTYLRWINYIWSFHMNREHEELHTAAECQAGLQVHMALGALIEGIITLISRVVALESVNWNPEISLSTNAIVTTVLVLAEDKMCRMIDRECGG